MKIIFLNTWDCKVEGAVENYIFQNAKDTDIFCLQEAYEKTKWLLRPLLNNYQCVSDYKYISDIENFPMVTYYKKELSLISCNTLLKEIPKVGLALATTFIHKETEIHVCNVHGISRPDNKLDTESRLLQSQELINAYKNVNGIRVIGGDFNLNEDSNSVSLFKQNDYANLIADFAIDTTRNRLVWERYPETKMYYSDYVFVNDKKYVQDFEVPKNEISDHLPLVLKLKI